MTIIDLLKRAQAAIASDSARLDAELLLAFCLGRNRSFLYAWPEKTVDDTIVQTFEALVQRRCQGEPIAYLIGTRDFWSLQLEVNSSTLIPRPETEKLVAIALQLQCDSASVLDLGTGTGAIALALAKERTAWQVLGVDINTDAVQLAQRNAEKNQIANVRFAHSNWFAAVAEAFDLIVANPPYIAADDPHLQQGDVRFEPQRALVADDQGMAAISTIAQSAPRYLAPGGWLLLEHGWEQGIAARATLSRNGFADVTTWCDDGGRDRVTGGKLPEARAQ
ncbi:MAG: peptide chain release factor N(5)-glutamine methyltransferase [Spongiibacteraceae bacterium]